MPAIYKSDCGVVASLSQAWPAPTAINLLTVVPERCRFRVFYL